MGGVCRLAAVSRSRRGTYRGEFVAVGIRRLVQIKMTQPLFDAQLVHVVEGLYQNDTQDKKKDKGGCKKHTHNVKVRRGQN